MNLIMRTATMGIILLSCIFISCKDDQRTVPEVATTVQYKSKGHELVHAVVEKVGDYNNLLGKKNVTYTYTYKTPDGKADISTERYIFDGELSYGYYHKHERTLPQLEGTIEQGYDGKEYWLKHNGKVLTDDKQLKRVAFNRPTNFYWFTMLQKLMDPGIDYDYLGESTINDQLYDIVKISFITDDDKPTDIYQLYINKTTLLIDQFLFTVADFGKIETPLLMRMSYEEVEGILIPSKREYKLSTWNADVSDEPWIEVTWSDIRFNSDFSKENFLKINTMNIEDNINASPLKLKLDEKKANFESKASDNKKRAYQEGLESVEKSGVTTQAKQVGEKAPDFILNNALGQPVELSDYLKKGKVVLTWYRGGWCPYCNLTLHQLQEELPNFKAAGASLLALTPELPDKSISTAEKHELEFEVLSDVGNKIAREYGIVFKLTDEVAEMYNNSFDLNSHNGDKSNELPLAATYIIDENGTIIYAFLDADYRNRAEPSAITNFLRK